MTKDKALEMALEFIERVNKDGWILADFEPQMYETITAIKEALAQPEQEPVGKFAKFTDGIWREVTDGSAGVSLYTTPPQRTWVGLSDEDRSEILNRKWWNFEDEFDVDGFLRLAEAKLKEKSMTHEEQIAKLTEMLEIQQKLHETAIDMLKPAIEAEREACAKVCESMNKYMDDGEECAKAIRARSEA